MNYGPLEFAALLKRKGADTGESAAVRAAREAAPVSAAGELPMINRLTVISGGALRPRSGTPVRVDSADD
jgi:hypothetical protein